MVVKEEAAMKLHEDQLDRTRPDGPHDGDERVRREVDVEASPEEVFEALITEEGRDRWLDEPDREIHIESVEAPHRLVWWWAGDEEPATRVEFRILALPRGTRIVVTESAPSLPLASLAASFALVAA
jgi:uncharacterized protein YndB with AHSA1/START domain